MNFPVALQLYSVRHDLAEDYYGTLKKVKEMGYDGVELSGLGENDPIEVRNMLSELGLELTSSHAPAEVKNRRTSFKFVPIGCGCQDISAILEAAKNNDVKWIIVEQDKSEDRPPIEAARMSLEYLRSL